MRASVRFGFLFLVLAATVSCAQDARSTSPTAPAPLAGSLTVGPGANYDASGSWHFALTPPRAGETVEFDAVFHPDANGNITFIEPEGGLLITLTRLGSGDGRVIPYELSSFKQQSTCSLELSGTVTLDTQTNTGRATIKLAEVGDNCRHGGFPQTAILTKK